jgi:hypothetical protein
MTEDDPFDGAGEMEATKVQLKGPNVLSTFEVPLTAGAVKAQDAAIRKHLQDQRRGDDPPAT